jgi:hypothetical protein
MTTSQEIAKLDWSQFNPWGGARCLPAMVLALGLGLYFHEPAAGMIVAGGTLSVGFSSFRRLQGSRLLQMFLTSFGMSCGATLGTVAGQSHLATTLGAGLLGFLYGLALVFSENASWIGLQGVIAFLVASAFPDHGSHALIRGALVLVGGLLQIGMVVLLSRDTRSLADDFRGCDPGAVLRHLRTEVWPTMLRQVDHRLPVMRYAIRLSLTLILAVVVARSLHQLNSYWLPMTALLVMKPDFYRTYTNCLARVLGTFAGVLLASLITFAFHPQPLLLVALVLVFAWSCFAGQKVNYAIFTCSLTAWIVFLIAIAGLPEITVTVNRLLDTALGSLIALGSRAVGPRWEIVAVRTGVKGA